MSAARAGALRLLYVAPERFASDQFLRLLGELAVARFVVDEAHCVSEWGHDFRPDYRRLRAAAALCRTIDRAATRPPIAAFTATATPEVRDDIVALLGLEEPQVLVAGFDRPNIYLRVERADSDEDKNELLPGLVRGRRALVYAATRKTTEAAAACLEVVGCRGGRVSRRSRGRRADARAGRVCRRIAAGGVRDQRVRHGHRPPRRRRRRPLRDSGIGRGVLPGDRARRPRRACRDRDAAVGPGRRVDAAVPHRQSPPRQARTQSGADRPGGSGEEARSSSTGNCSG